MKVEKGTVVQEPTTRTVGIDNENYVIVIDPATGNAIKEARINADEFNKAVSQNKKVADQLVKSNYDLGPGKASIDQIDFKKITLDESLFSDANKF